MWIIKKCVLAWVLVFSPTALAELPAKVFLKPNPTEHSFGIGVNWATSGRALVGDFWLGPNGLESLDCDDRTIWPELGTLSYRARPACGAPRPNRPLLCEPKRDKCLRVSNDAIVLNDIGRETKLLSVLPEDVGALAPREGDEVVISVGQRSEDGKPELDPQTYGSQRQRFYRFLFEEGALAEVEPFPRTYVKTLHFGLAQRVRVDGSECLTRQGRERCWADLSEVVALRDGAIVVIPGSTIHSGTLLRLNSALEKQFNIQLPHTWPYGTRVVPQGNDTVLVMVGQKVTVLNQHTGAEVKSYSIRMQDQGATTDEVLSADGSKFFSCERGSLWVRNAKTGQIDTRFKNTCSLNAEDMSGPYPSPDGNFVAILATNETSVIIRSRDGARLVLKSGLTSDRVRSFFSH